MRTIKDVFKKVDEMKNTKEMFENEGTDFTAGYEQALEDVKPGIEKGIKEILKEFKGEDVEIPIELNYKPGISEQNLINCGSEKREQKLREDIERIIGRA